MSENVQISLDEEKKLNELLDQGIDDLIKSSGFSLNKTEKTFNNNILDPYSINYKNKFPEISESKINAKG